MHILCNCPKIVLKKVEDFSGRNLNLNGKLSGGKLTCLIRSLERAFYIIVPFSQNWVGSLELLKHIALVGWKLLVTNENT